MLVPQPVMPMDQLRRILSEDAGTPELRETQSAPQLRWKSLLPHRQPKQCHICTSCTACRKECTAC